MDSQKPFWTDVRIEREKLSQLLAKGQLGGQPQYDQQLRHINYDKNPPQVTDHNPVYMVSKDNRKAGTSAGVIFIMPVYLAGQRIVEETHLVATEEQIEEYKVNQEILAEENRKASVQRKLREGNININMPADSTISGVKS